MKATKLCPAPHLEAADLDAKNDTEVTIIKCSFEEVGAEQVTKGVVFFEEFDRGMVLNRTNLSRIVDLHGDETDDWKGKKLALYQSETEFNGRTVDCIRVRQKK